MAYTAIANAKRRVGYKWTTSDFNTLLKDNFAAGIPGAYTTKGDILVGTAADAGARLAVGSNTQVLTVDSSTTTGLKWVGGSMPVGMIILWSGATGAIPTGWQICDGTNGTPDLRGRMVVCAGGAYAVGDAGGGAVDASHTHLPDASSDNATNAHTHTQAATGAETQVASEYHKHTLSSTITSGAASGIITNATAGANNVAQNGHTHNLEDIDQATASHTHTNPTSVSTDFTHLHPATASASGGSATTLPPYHALCYIQRLT